MEKYKIVNFLIGATIAIVLSMLILLGLRIFIPAASYPSRDFTSRNCPVGDMACQDLQQLDERARSQQYSADMKEYEVAKKAYSGKIFVAANIIGIIVLILGILVFALKLGTNIAAGIIISGAYGIIYGYILGWQGADDKLKFVVGVIVAIILIGGGIMVNKMRDRASQLVRSEI